MEFPKSKGISWLDKPILHILDIGAGTGAATVALLDLLCSYYEFRWSNGYVVNPTTVYIAAIEPSKSALKVFQRFLSELSHELLRLQITIHTTLISEEFPHPDCIETIKQNWRLQTPRTLIAISSNVIYWTQHSYERANAWLRFLGGESKLELGEVEAQAFHELLVYYGFKEITLLDIATPQLRKRSLFDLLKEKGRSFIEWFTSSETPIKWWKLEEKAEVNFLNSQATFWGQECAGREIKKPYLYCIRKNAEPLYEVDLSWLKMLKAANLELAWVRTRYFMLRDDLLDEIEIRLADFFWESYIERLKNYLTFELHDILTLDHCLFFAGPKNLTSDRPRYILRMGEQTISAALSQCHPEAFEPVHDYIFGNRLNNDSTEFFYEPWFKHFKKYSESINRLHDTGQVLWKLDVKSFYTNISQGLLARKLRREIGASKRSPLRKIINQIIIRPLFPPCHHQHHGLPQSGITAGLWSNIYLKDIDQLMFSTDMTEVATFYRYADDMTVVADSSDMDGVVKQIGERLNDPLKLQLNPKKTLKYSLAEYRKKNSQSDRRYDDLGNRAKWLMRSLYHLPKEYKQAKAKDRASFLKGYEQLLNGIGVFFSDFPYWLNRKIYQNDSFRHRIEYNIRVFRKQIIPVNLPQYHMAMTEKQKIGWCRDFQQNNLLWCKERDSVITELTTFFYESSEAFENSIGDEKTNARRAMRFAAYRLSWFGVATIAKKLEQILSINPWAFLPRTMLKALVDSGFQENVLTLSKSWNNRELPSGVNEQGEDIIGMECAHSLCAAGCRAIGYGEATDNAKEFLWHVLFSSDSHAVECIAASEALLRLKVEVVAQHYSQLIQLSKEKETNSYLTKNLILLIAQSNEEEWEDTILDIGEFNPDLIVIDAIQYALLSKGKGCIMDEEEPEVVGEYYSKWYPDVPIKIQSSSYSNN